MKTAKASLLVISAVLLPGGLLLLMPMAYRTFKRYRENFKNAA